jgi:hypothetical protein
MIARSMERLATVAVDLVRTATAMSKTAAEFRREAAICEDIARRLSIKEDREVLLQTAQRLLRIAEQMETGELPDVPRPTSPESPRDPPSG